MTIESDLPLLRLLQLASPALPIGMYSYSQGLEKAVEDGWVADEASLAEWLEGSLSRGVARIDAPLLARLYHAWRDGDEARATVWSECLRACRETQELRLEDRQTGQALARVLAELEIAEAAAWIAHPSASLAAMFALAGARWNIPLRALMAGYCWGWLENQVLAALKLASLGQAAGQRVLARLARSVPDAVESALRLDDEAIGGAGPALAIASSRHETQYSRLFRS